MKNAAAIFGRKPRATDKAVFLSVPWKLPDQLIGIEIEAENVPGSMLPDSAFPYWERKRDGSLRNGNEYVLVAPLKGDTLAKAIAELYQDAVFTRTATGSTHIHIDMLEETTTHETIKALVLMIYALEGALFSMVGVGREWCGFTNRLTSAPDEVLGAVLNSSEETEYRELINMCNNAHTIGRYYGLNLQALQKFGSVEFRYFPTATSIAELVDWIQLVLSFKKAAMEVGTSDELVRIFNNEDLYQRFINTHFSEWAEKIFNTVPYFIASALLKKAVAVAEAHRIETGTEWKFHANAIVHNPLFAKFATKKLGDVTPTDILLIGDYANAPEAREVGDGRVMMYNTRVYISSDGSWHQAGFEDASRSSVMKAKASLLAFLPKMDEVFTARRTDTGNEVGDHAANYYRMRSNDALRYMDRYLDRGGSGNTQYHLPTEADVEDIPQVFIDKPIKNKKGLMAQAYIDEMYAGQDSDDYGDDDYGDEDIPDDGPVLQWSQPSYENPFSEPVAATIDEIINAAQVTVEPVHPMIPPSPWQASYGGRTVIRTTPAAMSVTEEEMRAYQQYMQTATRTIR